MISEFCADASPVFFNLLDFSIAPPLLYYAYIPIVLFSLWMAVRFYANNKRDKSVILFSAISLSLAFLVLSNLLSWIAAPVWLVTLSWQLWGISNMLLPLFTFLFVFNLVYGRPLNNSLKYILYVLLIPVLVTLPTKLNVYDFDYESCEGVVTNLTALYVYSYQALIILGLCYLLFKSVFKVFSSFPEKKKLVLVSSSAILFIVFFMATAMFGDYISDYRIELIAPIGAVLFLVGVSYFAIDNNKFNANVLGAEMLVVVLFIIMGSIMLVGDINYVHSVTSASLIFVTLIGYYLIKSVKKEIEQRKEIEELVTRLRSVNKVLSHDVKGALGKHAMLFRALADGDFGPVSDQARVFVEQSAKDATKLVDAIMVMLQSGHDLTFHPSKFDIGILVRDIVESSKTEAEKKGLVLNLKVDDTSSLMVDLDQSYIKMHVVQNLISNAINYTLQGNIDVYIGKASESRIMFSVKDSGIGISKSDAPKMFSEGGHGEHSAEVNVHSTGYGLFSAKRVVDACGGKIWFESEGIPGKGTIFCVELPLVVQTTEEKLAEK